MLLILLVGILMLLSKKERSSVLPSLFMWKDRSPNQTVSRSFAQVGFISPNSVCSYFLYTFVDAFLRPPRLVSSFSSRSWFFLTLFQSPFFFFFCAIFPRLSFFFRPPFLSLLFSSYTSTYVTCLWWFWFEQFGSYFCSSQYCVCVCFRSIKSKRCVTRAHTNAQFLF